MKLIKHIPPWLLSLFLCTGIAACTQKRSTPPPTESPTQGTHEDSFTARSSAQLGDCRFTWLLPRDAWLNSDTGSAARAVLHQDLDKNPGIGQLSIDMSCNGPRDPWSPVFEDLSEGRTPSEQNLLEAGVDGASKNFKSYPLSSATSRGAAYTTDEDTGDEAQRTRSLFFCLKSRSDADNSLCGFAVVRRLAQPDSDITQRVLAIARSIEFDKTQSLDGGPPR